VGSGGVGKTTVAAALGAGLAARGEKVAVVTIDPARRLATALGVAELGNEPRRVDPALFSAHGLELTGELWAMMLDPKRTFDDLIDSLAPDEATRDEILANRIYSELSSAVAGSQEFTAMVKLYELHAAGDYDTLVLDTPPSRNALDFLEAPTRITQFLEGRAVRVFLAPSGIAGRVVGRGTGLVFRVLERLTGVDLLRDLSVFFRSLSGVLDGFRERSTGVGALLRDPASTFVIVTSPERGPVEEACFLHERLAEAGMPYGALIVNRVHPPELTEADPDAARAPLESELGPRLGARVLANLADFSVLAARDRQSIAELLAALGEDSASVVPHLDSAVAEAGGLVAIERHLF